MHIKAGTFEKKGISLIGRKKNKIGTISGRIQNVINLPIIHKRLPAILQNQSLEPDNAKEIKPVRTADISICDTGGLILNKLEQKICGKIYYHQSFCERKIEWPALRQKTGNKLQGFKLVDPKTFNKAERTNSFRIGFCRIGLNFFLFGN